jgi:MFS family permease
MSSSPLPLDESARGDAASSEPLLEPLDRESDQSHGTPRAILRRAAVFMAFHFCIAFCEMILIAPLLSLFERSICLSHYMKLDPSFIGPDDWVEEIYCKVPSVQRELARVRGWKGALDTLPVLLVAIPVGKLADRYGRKKLMSLNLIGVLVAMAEIMVVVAFPRLFSIRLVWASSVLLLFGGGLYTTAALMWAMASSTFDDDSRSKAFYYIFSAFYFAELVASALASVTMDTSPWIGCLLAFCSIFGALMLLYFMPTAASPVKLQDESSEDQGATTFKQALSNRNILLTLPVFLVGALRYTVLSVLMQHVSLRFGWSISTTALLYTETAVVTISLFFILVPQVTKLLRRRYAYEAAVLDLGLVRMSVALMCIGTLSIALSRSSLAIFLSVLVFAAGFGSRVSTLSLVSYWTSEESKGSFYAAIAVLENIGHAVGDPSLQHIYAAVLWREGALQSLPFFVASTLYGFATVSALCMSLNRGVQRDRSHSA